MTYEDGLLAAILFIFLWLQRRRALRRRTHLSRETARGRCVAHFRLKTKAKADVFSSSDFEQFCKGDFGSTNDLGEAKES